VKQNSQIWQIWAENLNRWGVKDLTATILEALGPLSLLGAQIVYVGQPLSMWGNPSLTHFSQKDIWMCWRIC